MIKKYSVTLQLKKRFKLDQISYGFDFVKNELEIVLYGNDGNEESFTVLFMKTNLAFCQKDN